MGAHGAAPRAADRSAATSAPTAAATSSSADSTTPSSSAALPNRDDNLAITYRGGVVLRAITPWLQALGDTP